MITHRMLPTLLVMMALLPVFYVAAPLFHLVSGLTEKQFIHALLNPEFDRAVMTSLTAAVITTASALVFGLPTAFFLSLKDFFGKRLIESLLLLPLILPPVVGGIGQLFLYGPMTPIGTFFSHYHLPLTDSVVGVVLAQSYITSPFMILAAKAGFEEVPKELHEVTRTMGGGIWHIFWFVSIPLAKGAIFSGMALTFARSIGEFGATMIMAYHPYTLPVDIWVQFASGGLKAIIPITAVVIVFAFLVSFLGSLASKHSLFKA